MNKIIISCLMVFAIIACDGGTLRHHINKNVDICYKSDSIIINIDESIVTLIEKDGNYYTDDDILFLSTSKDTTIILGNGFGTSIYAIKPDTINGYYSTSCYFANNNDSAALISQYCYDKNYKIKGIKVITTIEYY